MLDYLIINSTVVDGSGMPSFKANVGIEGKEISYIGDDAPKAKHVIDGTGLYTAPGFVDPHCHTDLLGFLKEQDKNRLLNGITTDTTGLCGVTMFPLSDEHKETFLNSPTAGMVVSTCVLKDDHEWDWHGFADYAAKYDKSEILSNMATYVGHGTIRIAAMGMENRKPTDAEMAKMKEMLEECLENGAIGMTLGLIYPPGVFSQKDELIELAKVVKKYNKHIAVHMRNESDYVLDSIEEMLDIARVTGVHMHISHHKVAGKNNHGKSVDTLALIDKANAEGLTVTLDVYPYTAGATSLAALLPPYMHGGGSEMTIKRLQEPGAAARIAEEIKVPSKEFDSLAAGTTWDKVLVLQTKTGKYDGKNIAEIAKLKGVGDVEALCELIVENDNKTFMAIFLMDYDDVDRIVCHDVAMIGSDGMIASGANHARYVGTFVKAIVRYVKEEKLLTIEQAIHKMTQKPCKLLELTDRGVIKEGMKADIVMFDLDMLDDATTYENYTATSEGIRHVFVNGALAVENHKFTDTYNGKFLRSKGGQ